jgi:nitrogen regulatory protein PII
VKLEIVVADTRLKLVMDTLAEAARSGKIGDGKIFISTIEEAVRIRNGDTGEGAL